MRSWRSEASRRPAAAVGAAVRRSGQFVVAAADPCWLRPGGAAGRWRPPGRAWALAGDACPAAGTAGRAAKLDRMSSREQSLSMFVVQRTFRRVRRGYDPVEVDRHLELVSGWFTSTRVGEALSHVRAELQERERRLDEREVELARALEGARLEADGLLEGARRRAEADTGAAEQALADARKEAAAIRTAAERERAELRDEARRGGRRGGHRGGSRRGGTGKRRGPRGGSSGRCWGTTRGRIGACGGAAGERAAHGGGARRGRRRRRAPASAGRTGA
jgi:DivIVA domain-containing protein